MTSRRTVPAWNKKRPGAALLILVLVIGAISLVLGTSIALGSIGELSMGYADVQSKKALAIADGCVEETLLRLRSDHSYAGKPLTMDDGTCSVAIIDSAGAKRITVSATAGRWTQTVVVTADLSGTRVAILDWKAN